MASITSRNIYSGPGQCKGQGQKVIRAKSALDIPVKKQDETSLLLTTPLTNPDKAPGPDALQLRTPGPQSGHGQKWRQSRPKSYVVWFVLPAVFCGFFMGVCNALFYMELKDARLRTEERAFEDTRLAEQQTQRLKRWYSDSKEKLGNVDSFTLNFGRDLAAHYHQLEMFEEEIQVSREMAENCETELGLEDRVTLETKFDLMRALPFSFSDLPQALEEQNRILMEIYPLFLNVCIPQDVSQRIKKDLEYMVSEPAKAAYLKSYVRYEINTKSCNCDFDCEPNCRREGFKRIMSAGVYALNNTMVIFYASLWALSLILAPVFLIAGCCVHYRMRSKNSKTT